MSSNSLSILSFRLGRPNLPHPQAINPSFVPKSPNPVRFGIIGAANIAPIALVNPVRSHPDVVILAVAARDIRRAEAFAKKYDILKAYGGYQEMLEDPEIDAVYNPLPNGLHYEWTMKALAAGKHVLLEKPCADTAEEVRQMFELAERKGLVLLEAFHYRFHPAIQRVKEILDSGELGVIKNISTTLCLPNGFINAGDIRWNYDLGGGAMMDVGCYALNCLRYLTSSDPTSVITVMSTPYSPPSKSTSTASFAKVDSRTVATLGLPSSVTATLVGDLSLTPRFGFIPRWPDVKAVVECERGELEMLNFVMPTIYHRIKVSVKESKVSKKKIRKVRVEKKYDFGEGGRGQDWWTTYRYQLECFVDKIQGKTPQTWVTKEDSIANMKWIEEIYKVWSRQ